MKITARVEVTTVLTQRMRKRQQMRWSQNGVHLLAQVRCAVIHGDLADRLARYEPLTSPAQRNLLSFWSNSGSRTMNPKIFNAHHRNLLFGLQFPI